MVVDCQTRYHYKRGEQYADYDAQDVGAVSLVYYRYIKITLMGVLFKLSVIFH